MDEVERERYEATAQELRADLKRFEGDWARTHGNSKPARHDIKANPDIAHKYKKYNQVRDILSGKIPPPTKSESRNRKSKEPAVAPAAATPLKRARLDQTPSKSSQKWQGREEAPTPSASAETPSNRKLFSPAIPTSIGPTPHRDGRILGLFDLLVEEDDDEAGTPSKRKHAVGNAPRIQATPCKRKATHSSLSAYHDDATGISEPGRTPTTRRTFNASATTPLKPRDPNALTTPRHVMGNKMTPGGSAIKSGGSNTSSKQYATPAFLRRAPPPPPALKPGEGRDTGDGAVYPSPQPRLPRRTLFGRGLSGVIASLRKLEEERDDDDEEAMRELEMEAACVSGGPPPKKKQKHQHQLSAPLKTLHPNAVAETATGVQSVAKESVATEDREDTTTGTAGTAQDIPDGQSAAPPPEEEEEEESWRKPDQRPRLLGGFDDEDAYDSSTGLEREGLDRDGRPLRVYKKKGQKRTTRRVNMRPTRTKRPAAADDDKDKDGAGNRGNADEDVVLETQFDATKSDVLDEPLGLLASDGESDEGGNGHGHDDDDYGSDDGHEDYDYNDEDGNGGKKKRKQKGKKQEQPKKAAKSAEKKKAKGKNKYGENDDNHHKEEDGTAGGKIKRAARKISATANANFRRLKLRNTGSKGGPGFGSRFRRKR